MNNQARVRSVYLRPLVPGNDNQTLSDLRFLYQHSDKQYKLTDNQEEADIILIALPGNRVPFRYYAKNYVTLNIPANQLDKTFAVSLHRAKHMFLMRGVYESAGTSGTGRSDRIRSGAYSERAFNTYIQELPAFNQHCQLLNRTYLFSFIGRNCHPVRDAIFKLKPRRADVLIEDSSDFDVWSETKSKDFHKRLQYYTEVIQSSKFSLCPRGFGVNSIRLFESMKMGICPVIISDEWKLPKGPDWNKCSVIINENRVEKLEQIITEREDEFLVLGRKAAEIYGKYFSRKKQFNYIINNCLDIQDSQKIPERFWWKLRYLHYSFAIIYRLFRIYFIKSKRIFASVLYAFKRRLFNLCTLTF